VGVNRCRFPMRALGAVCTVVAVALTFPGGPGTAATPPVVETTATPAAPPAVWQTAWTSPMDFYGGTAEQATARDVATVAIGGTAIKLRLSNGWSGTPTTFGAVTVGVQQSGASIVPGSAVPVTFDNGDNSVTVPAMQDVTSDSIPLTVHAGESLAVSLWVAGPATVSVHYCCDGHVDSYATPNGAGDHAADPAGASFSVAETGNMRWLSAIEVSGTPAVGTVVAFGDSITDGYKDGAAGWPTFLQQRIGLLPPSDQVSVVNEGISGNTLTAFPSSPPNLTYALTSGGSPGVTRLWSDALSLPGTRDVVLFLGTNDIWFGGRLPSGLPYGNAASIISAMQSVIAQVHAAGMRIYAVTFLPRTTTPPGPKQEVWTPTDQANLVQVNAWIHSNFGGFDGTIDLAAVVADVYNGQCDSTSLFGPYNSGDNLHPSVAGQVAMADAIPTTLFQIPEAPQLPPSVAAIPTQGCPGAVEAERALTLARASTPSTTMPSATTSPRRDHRSGLAASQRDTKPSVVAKALVGTVGVVLVGMALLVRRRRIVRRRSRGLRHPGSSNHTPVHRSRSVGKEGPIDSPSR